jgi:AIPR protein.
VDGGHTYKIIKELKDKTTPGTQFVKLEILTGVEDIFTKLAAARNTSVQVEDKSIAELEKRFEIIKTVLQNDSTIIGRLSFKQNEDGAIDISEVLAILNLFNLSEYPNNQTDNYPIQSYSGRAKCTERYINAHKKYEAGIDNPYVKMSTIIPDILKLYNKLEVKMNEYYTAGSPGGRYGSVKGVSGGVGRQEQFSKIYGQKMDFSTPTGFIYPILGAFRSLVVIKEDGYYDWAIDPFATMDKLGKDLVGTTVDRSRTLGNNPQSVGKDRGNWHTLYLTIKMHLLEQQS